MIRVAEITIHVITSNKILLKFPVLFFHKENLFCLLYIGRGIKTQIGFFAIDLSPRKTDTEGKKKKTKRERNKLKTDTARRPNE